MAVSESTSGRGRRAWQTRLRNYRHKLSEAKIMECAAALMSHGYRYLESPDGSGVYSLADLGLHGSEAPLLPAPPSPDKRS